ncbi:MAG: hypothetical protein M1825_005699 [Sarcosagium campestre]|nr:MAG: hypothetical protein M1825_005699 [Sarcosagium campestre]
MSTAPNISGIDLEGKMGTPSAIGVSADRISSAEASAKSPSKNLPATEQGSKKWATENLLYRIGADAGAAASAGVLIAPIITLIDRAIIENASGRNAMMPSIKASVKQLLFRPQQFIFSKPFGLIYMLYSSTYLTANTLDTMFSTIHSTPPSTTTAGLPKFLATSTTNMSLCLYKDSQFARLFGPPNSVPRPVPTASLALFAIRDSLTIFASFNLPPLLSKSFPGSDDAWDRAAVGKLSVAQFVAPAGVQLLSTPLHLLGLDLYNRGGKDISRASRWDRIRRDWAKSSLARMCRIVPAFGVGGVVNTKVRKELMGRIERP